MEIFWYFWKYHLLGNTIPNGINSYPGFAISLAAINFWEN